MQAIIVNGAAEEMKRKREKQIMLESLSKHGFEVAGEVEVAVAEGLKSIRREKFETRKAQKARPDTLVRDVEKGKKVIP